MATLNTADQLRFLMADEPRLAYEIYSGDGSGSSFMISGSPIVTGATSLGAFSPSAFVTASGGKWTSTAATFAFLNGTVTFSAVLGVDVPFMVQYTYGTFSDQEIDFITSLYSTLPAMQLKLVDNLMGNAYKRARWAGGAGSYFDDSQTMANLMKMRSALWAENTTEQGPQGGFVSWGSAQESYDSGPWDGR